MPFFLFMQWKTVGANICVTSGVIPIGITFVYRIFYTDNLPLHIIFIVIFFIVGYWNIKGLRPRADNYLIVRDYFVPV